MNTSAMYVDVTRGESYPACARPTDQRGLRMPAFGADTTGERDVPDRHVVRGPDGSPGPRPARPAVNIHSFIQGVGGDKPPYDGIYRGDTSLTLR